MTRHPSNDANDLKYPCIWVRTSQTKIHYSDQDLAHEPAKRTIDVLRASHMRSGIQASKEVLVNFAENGVPHEILSRRMRESLEELMEQLLQWDDMLQLYRLVFKEGGILGARMAREVAGEARVRGYRAYDNEDDDKEEDERISEVLELGPERSKAWQVDEISGLPSSLEVNPFIFRLGSLELTRLNLKSNRRPFVIFWIRASRRKITPSLPRS